MKKEKEIKTVHMMISMYCHHYHKSKKDILCEDCVRLLDYVKNKRSKCPYGDNKNYCSVCKIHCYKGNEEMREKIKAVMRYAAPRMCVAHPILSISHIHQTIKNKRKEKKEHAR